jgi:glycosyltransferase involved in cell wall biosynthesis
MPETGKVKHALYICYFGLRQPLVQTQVVPYLQEIAKAGIRVSLLTFEPDFGKAWTASQIENTEAELMKKNIEWSCLPYHKSPSAIATAYDIFRGVSFIRRIIRDENIDILHGRVHVATLMGALARKLSKRKPKLIFDIRGFFPEEYTDAGVWPENGTLYKAAKRVEKWLMRESDGFVVLTEKARGLLFGELQDSSTDEHGKPVEVIPCCVDLRTRFRPEEMDRREAVRTKLGISDRFVFTHLGALGGLYLTEHLVDLLDSARSIDPGTFAMFLTQTKPDHVISLLQARGFSENDYFVGMVDPADVPAYLAAADAGLSFVQATYATQSRSPTKIPEYLAAGLPIIANSGVGDVDELLTTEGVGVLLDGFDRESYVDAIRKLRSLSGINEKCRETAHRRFDLESVGGERYRRLYKRILQS